MARRSTKDNKSKYQICREAQGLTRAKAAEKLGWISEDRIERIEGGALPHPDEVVAMARKYPAPELCNYYCANECDIGKVYIPEVEFKSLSQITVEMLATLNRLTKEKERLLEIAYDGKISEAEIPDFISLRMKLDDMANIISSLRLWVEQQISAGAIDKDMYKKHENNILDKNG